MHILTPGAERAGNGGDPWLSVVSVDCRETDLLNEKPERHIILIQELQLSGYWSADDIAHGTSYLIY